MSLYAYARPRVKSRSVRPVRRTVILFDATRFTPAPFCGRTPRAAQPKTTLDLTASEMRRVDRVRSDAYADAVDMLGEQGATEYAAEVAEKAVAKVRMARQVREKRAVASDADSLWWFMNSEEPDWDQLANEREAEDRLTAGCLL